MSDPSKPAIAAPEAILEFWFGPEPGAFRDEWFRADAAFDAVLARDFATAWQAACAGQLDGWPETPRGALALVLLLDQLSRNLNRDSPLAFAADPRARAVVNDALARGLDASLAPIERSFLYLPFMHSETIADQERGLDLYRALPDSDWRHRNIDSATAHLGIIGRFGRFPHRNAVLGRESTEEELAFLAAEGRGF